MRELRISSALAVLRSLAFIALSTVNLPERVVRRSAERWAPQPRSWPISWSVGAHVKTLGAVYGELNFGKGDVINRVISDIHGTCFCVPPLCLYGPVCREGTPSFFMAGYHRWNLFEAASVLIEGGIDLFGGEWWDFFFVQEYRSPCPGRRW